MTSVIAVGRDVADPGIAPFGVAGAATGGLGIAPGTYRYKYTWLTRYGETLASPASSVITSTNSSIDLEGILKSDYNDVIARKIYRTTEGAMGPFLLLITIADNITTTYTDITSDAGLGTAEPIANFASTLERTEGWMTFTRQIGRSQGDIIAAGGTQNTATPTGVFEYVFVSVPVDGNGIRLPAINANMIGVKITINNIELVNNLNIYPYEVSSTINGGVPGAPILLAPSFSMEFICDTATNWRFASSLTAGVAGPPSGAAGGDLTGFYPAPALVATGVVPGAYGNPFNIPVVTYDANGRAVSATTVLASTVPGGPATGDLTGLYPSPNLTATGVVAGTYGSATFTPVISVDTKGRVTSATSTLINAVASGPAAGDLTGSYPNPTLAISGVSAGTYGSTSQVPVIAIDSKGRVTSATSVALTSSPGGPATGDLAGTYPAPTLSLTGVTAGTYGSAMSVPVLSVDAKGRITSATSIASGGGPPTGVAGGSLTGNYPSPNLSTTGVSIGTYTKVTVNLEGRVTNASSLVGTDLPIVTGDVSGPYVSTIVQFLQGVRATVSTADKIMMINGNTANTGTSNSAYGINALIINSTGVRNAAFGADALSVNTGGNDNSAFGVRAMAANTTGLRNTAVGKDSLKANITQSDNTSLGYNALSVATATGNTSVGSGSGSAITSGSSNITIGLDSASSLTSGSDNVVIGAAAGGVNLDNGSNNIIIGSGASPSAPGVSDEITLGNSSITRVRFASASVIPVYANNAAALVGGLVSGMLYRTNGATDFLCIAH